MFKTIKCITGRPNLGWITLNNHFPRLGMLMVVHYPMVKPLIKHGGIHLSDIKGIYLDITDITSISKKDVDIVQSSLWLLCHVFLGRNVLVRKWSSHLACEMGRTAGTSCHCWHLAGIVLKFLVFHIYIHSPWYDCIILYRCLIKSLKMSKTKIRRKKKFFGWYRWYPQGI